MLEKLTTMFQYLMYVIVGIFCLSISLFLIERNYLEQKTNRNTFIANIDVSQKNKKDFFDVLSEYEDTIRQKQIILTHQNQEFSLYASELGIGFDKEILFADQIQFQRASNIVDSFFVWVISFFDSHDFFAETLINNEILDQKIQEIVSKIPEKDAFNGSLSIIDRDIETQLPLDGFKVDVSLLTSQVIDSFINNDSKTRITVPLLEIKAQRTAEEFKDLKYEIESLISFPINIYSQMYPHRNFDLSSSDLLEMLVIEIPENTSNSLQLKLDHTILAKKITKLFPRDSKIVLNNNKVVIVPEQIGFDINFPITEKNILEVAKSKKVRRAEYSIKKVIEPSVSESYFKSLKLEHLISKFTTYHSCCNDRVSNIQLAADILDGTVVMPGETISMNEVLGRRSTEGGFKPAGTIIKGEIVDSIGGGISQFITTLHNAVYWSGLEIVDYKTHSIYFSRYPKGIEATINWPTVDYVFKNNSNSAIYFDTSYTDTSISIAIYGSNFSRSVIGHHQNGVSSFDIEQGQKGARIVTSKVSPDYNFRPPVIEYVPDESVKRFGQIVEQVGEPIFSVFVNRRVHQNGEEISNTSSTVNYKRNNSIIRKNPCDILLDDYDYSKCNSPL